MYVCYFINRTALAYCWTGMVVRGPAGRFQKLLTKNSHFWSEESKGSDTADGVISFGAELDLFLLSDTLRQIFQLLSLLPSQERDSTIICFCK